MPRARLWRGCGNGSGWVTGCTFRLVGAPGPGCAPGRRAAHPPAGVQTLRDPTTTTAPRAAKRGVGGWALTPATRTHHTHPDTHTPTRSWENEPIAHENAHKVDRPGAPAPTHTTHPANAHSGTRCATHTTPIHPLRLSATLAAALPYSTRARARRPSAEPRAFHYPSRKSAPGPPNSPLALLAPSPSPPIPPSPGHPPPRRAWRPPLSRAAGRAPSHLAPSHLTAAAAARSRGARLGAPPPAPQPPQPPRPAGRLPGRGRGRGLPDSRSSQWLAAAASPTPIAARGPGLRAWGRGPAGREAGRRV